VAEDWHAKLGGLEASGSPGLWMLGAEWVLTVLVLLGSFLVITNHYDVAIDSAAVAVISTVIGYWFGRAVNRREDNK
jgi:hypothetical protein